MSYPLDFSRQIDDAVQRLLVIRSEINEQG